MNKKWVLIILAAVVIIIVSGIIGAEFYTSQPSFCGSCHIMKKYYNQWTKDKHGEKGVACVECHYAPGEHGTLTAKFKGLGQLFTYLGSKDALVRKPAKVNDASCLTSECHPREKFADKKLNFAKKIPYVHKTHFDKTVEGQALHCATCHQHVRGERHFQVPVVACYLCHFKNAEFNKDRGKCSLCHEIPVKPLQKQKKEGEAVTVSADSEEKPITHESMEKAQVSCLGCHNDLIQGSGGIKKENCFNCHEYSDEMQNKAEDKKVMHEEHVADQNANCFDCHEPITHKKTDFMDSVRLNCEACHPETHISQTQLIAGIGGKGIDGPYPIAHNDMRMNCFACHTKDGVDHKGIKVKRGQEQTCADCHTERQKNLARQWKEDVDEELKNAREVEKTAAQAIENARGKAPARSINNAVALLKDGRENLTLVDAGGGVHNKKYSMLLLETAVEKFEEAIEEVKK
ncbi:MAG: NapC/NirT family cytochrome c [Nitrospirae bacterium]|nr:NapC/NirT family cytochrome c [Nitrospirota bacterium]